MLAMVFKWHKLLQGNLSMANNTGSKSVLQFPTVYKA